MSIVERRIQEHLELAQDVLQGEIPTKLVLVAAKIRYALQTGHKIIFCGNGGSAADSQHLAAEFVGRFQKERRGLAALALTVDSSVLTAVGNDYGFDWVFQRQVEALGMWGDVLIGISTSGNSANVVNALQLAKSMGMFTVGFTAAGGGQMAELCDVNLAVPTEVTARAQEIHILLGHILCELADGE